MFFMDTLTSLSAGTTIMAAAAPVTREVIVGSILHANLTFESGATSGTADQFAPPVDDAPAAGEAFRFLLPAGHDLYAVSDGTSGAKVGYMVVPAP